MKPLIRLLTIALIALTACIVVPTESHAQNKSVEKLKKEKLDAARQIKETTRKLKSNTRETRRQLNRLETLRSDMKRQNEIMARARHSADSVDLAITRLNDTIARMDSSLAVLRDSYGKTLRRMQSAAQPTNAFSFILSADNFQQAYRRVRYLRQFTKWRHRKGEQVKNAQSQLAERRDRLADLGRKRLDALQRLDVASRKLKSQQSETETLVASLKKEESNLRVILKESEMRRKKLDNEIDRMIRQEQERIEKQRREAEAKAKERARREAAEKTSTTTSPSTQKTQTNTPSKTTTKPQPKTQVADQDRSLSGSFESNKGRLLFPVAGNYRIVRGFGRQPHSELKHVETDNSGIDIETSKGASARAVFNGTVSAIFRQPGFNTIVMVRHGEYITIYAGLGNISVKNGEKVKTGQTIGTVVADPDNDNRSVLHFELRHERQKLNPTHWVR